MAMLLVILFGILAAIVSIAVLISRYPTPETTKDLIDKLNERDDRRKD